MGYDRYIKIVLDHTKFGSDLTDFVFMINLSDSCGVTSADASIIFDYLSDSEKLKIKLEDESETQHYVEIETWSSSDKLAILNTKISPSSSEDQIYKLWYPSDPTTVSDNTDYVGIVGSTAGRNVYNSNIKANYTMAQDPSTGGACILDSTVNANHGTPYGSMASSQLVSGIVGKAINFDGSNDYINMGDVLDFGTDSVSICIVFKANTTNTTIFGGLVGKTRQASQFGRYAITFDSGKFSAFFQYDAINYTKAQINSDVVLNNEYNVVTIVFNRSENISIDINAVNVANSSSIASAFGKNINTANIFGVGAYQNLGGTAFTQAFLPCNVAHISLYSYVLSDSQKAAINFSLRDQIATFSTHINGEQLQPMACGLAMEMESAEIKMLFPPIICGLEMVLYSYVNYETGEQLPPIEIGLCMDMGSAEMQIPLSAMVCGSGMEIERFSELIVNDLPSIVCGSGMEIGSAEIQMSLSAISSGFHMLIGAVELQRAIPPLVCEFGLEIDRFCDLIVSDLPFIACGLGMEMGYTEMQQPLPAISSGFHMLIGAVELQRPLPDIICGFEMELKTIVIVALDDTFLRYYLTLTGSADGLDDIELPMSYFQARRRNGKDTWLSVTVPTVDFALQISARSNGNLRIDQGYILGGELLLRKTIINTKLDSVATYEGGKSQSVILTGYLTTDYTQKTVTLYNPTYREFSGGTIKYRLARPDLDLNPGDTAIISSTGETFEVDNIVYSVAPNEQLISIEAAA